MIKVLLVESNAADAQHHKTALEQCACDITVVTSGTAALNYIRDHQPEFVVAADQLSDIEGTELCKSIQAALAPTWCPVLLLGEPNSEERRVVAFEAGADAYLIKPVSSRMFAARMQHLMRSIERERRERQRAEALSRYNTIEEEDRRVAMHLMDRLVNREKLNDPALSYWIQPAASFSGDLIAAARTPGKSLYVLLADGTGHGLAASLNVLPITAPFYRMAERGFSIDAIVRELNSKVRELLPRDRFVAATLASINYQDGIVQIWNGGNPYPMLLVNGGTSAVTCASRHLPLGVLDQEELDTSLETHRLPEHGSLLMYSDGLLEAENAQGSAFGRARLQTALAGIRQEARIERLKRAVSHHLAGVNAHDDISVVVVDCDQGMKSESPQTSTPPKRAANPAERLGGSGGLWRVNMSLTAPELKRLDVIPMLLNLLQQFKIPEDHAGNLFTILSELFNNALDHGVLRLDSDLKDQPNGMEEYYNERAERLANLEFGSIDIGMSHIMQGGQAIEIMVRDSGVGFDHESAVEKVVHHALNNPYGHGRGILLLKRMCTEVTYRRGGAEVYVRYPLEEAARLEQESSRPPADILSGIDAAVLSALH